MGYTYPGVVEGMVVGAADDTVDPPECVGAFYTAE